MVARVALPLPSFRATPRYLVQQDGLTLIADGEKKAHNYNSNNAHDDRRKVSSIRRHPGHRHALKLLNYTKA
jgi:hypothetical protein